MWFLYERMFILGFPFFSIFCSYELYFSTFSCLDVALITSLRDGMNLVSYEFVACQASKKGVLILSEVIEAYYFT